MAVEHSIDWYKEELIKSIFPLENFQIPRLHPKNCFTPPPPLKNFLPTPMTAITNDTGLLDFLVNNCACEMFNLF